MRGLRGEAEGEEGGKRNKNIIECIYDAFQTKATILQLILDTIFTCSSVL